MTITFSPAQDGGGYLYEIDMSVIPSLPEWTPDASEPPLSVKSAVDIARKEISGMSLEQKMKFASIRLSSATVVGKSTVWYYSVTFINDAAHRKDGFMEETINILMNGRIIKARKVSKEEHGKWFR